MTTRPLRPDASDPASAAEDATGPPGRAGTAALHPERNSAASTTRPLDTGSGNTRPLDTSAPDTGPVLAPSNDPPSGQPRTEATVDDQDNTDASDSSTANDQGTPDAHVPVATAANDQGTPDAQVPVASAANDQGTHDPRASASTAAKDQGTHDAQVPVAAAANDQGTGDTQGLAAEPAPAFDLPLMTPVGGLDAVPDGPGGSLLQGPFSPASSTARGAIANPGAAPAAAPPQDRPCAAARDRAAAEGPPSADEDDARDPRGRRAARPAMALDLLLTRALGEPSTIPRAPGRHDRNGSDHDAATGTDPHADRGDDGEAGADSGPGAPPARRGRRLAVASALVLAVVGALVLGLRHAPAPLGNDTIRPAPVAVSVPLPALSAEPRDHGTVRIFPSADARWTLTGSPPSHLALESGAVLLEVLDTGPDGFRVTAEDWTLTVLGTVFLVEAGPLPHVRVLDGIVRVDGTGRDTTTVAAGERLDHDTLHALAPAEYHALSVLVPPAAHAVRRDRVRAARSASAGGAPFVDAALSAVTAPGSAGSGADTTGLAEHRPASPARSAVRTPATASLGGMPGRSGAAPAPREAAPAADPHGAPLSAADGRATGDRPPTADAGNTGARNTTAPAREATAGHAPAARGGASPRAPQGAAADSAVSPPTLPEEHLRTARSAHARGDHVAAARAYEAWLAHAPRDGTARLDVARLWLNHLDDPRRGVRHLERFLNDHPDDNAAPAIRRELCAVAEGHGIPSPHCH